MVGFRLSRVLPFFIRSRPKGDDGRSPAAIINHVEFQDPDCAGILRRQPQVVAAATGCCRPSRRQGSRRWSPHSSANDGVEGDIPPPPAAGDASMPDQYSWSKEGNYWHVVAGHADIGEELLPSSPRKKIDSDDGSVIFPPLDTRRRGADHRRPRRGEPATARKRPLRMRLSRSNSSPDDDDDDTDSGWFSADEENEQRHIDEYFDGYFRVSRDEETKTLISSTEFDSSAENATFRRKTTGPAGGVDGGRRRRRRRGRRSIRKSMSMAAEGAAAVRRLVPCVSTVAVRESFAVVKRSQDPRADFRQSMAEMVVEKEILDPSGLDQLLRCYLSLNSRRHHEAIIAAFREIWDALFFPEAAGRSW